MDLSNNIILVPLITGPFFILAGLIMWYFPPKEINGLYGYRTSSSMLNEERWEFAQKYAAQQMMKFGGILLLSSVIGIFYHPNDIIATIIGLALLIAVCILIFRTVERAIQNRFQREQP